MLRPIALSLAAGAAVAAATDLSARHSDDAAIRQTVQYYFDGGRNGDSTTLRKAFHPEARMLFVRDGRFTLVPIGDYIKRVTENRPAPGAVDSIERRIVSIDHAGDAAAAKLELRGPAGVTTDYMSLLKLDGRWVIVNKIFSRGAAKGHAAGR